MARRQRMRWIREEASLVSARLPGHNVSPVSRPLKPAPTTHNHQHQHHHQNDTTTNHHRLLDRGFSATHQRHHHSAPPPTQHHHHPSTTTTTTSAATQSFELLASLASTSVAKQSSRAFANKKWRKKERPLSRSVSL